MFKVGFSKDIHNLIKGNELKLGGIIVSTEYSFEAYSDGDVLLHAICESILGALGLEDLGTYFNSKNNKENFDSQLIVDFVNQQLLDQGYVINNIDTLIMSDEIKLVDYKKVIKENISNIFNTDINSISVKATTSEENFKNIVEATSIVSITKGE